MGFIDSYKQLEKLCGEVLNDDRRVSAYIDEMINIPDGDSYVKNWYKDLKKLKHYRWVRNKISHEPDCSELNMCEPDDERWLEDFYMRIVNQTDPLALYHKAIMSRKTVEQTQEPDESEYLPSRKNYNHSEQEPSGCATIVVITLLIVLVIVLIMFFHI